MKSRTTPPSTQDRRTTATLFLTSHLLLATATPFHQSRSHRLGLPACFAAGGGGGGGGFGTKKKTSTSPKKHNNNNNNNNNNNTKKNKIKSKSKYNGGLFSDDILGSSNPSSSSHPEIAAAVDAPPLDRFGLPLPTIDDVFPPLSPDIPRVPVQMKRSRYEFDRDEVAEAMKHHLGVDLNVFDDRGYSLHVERPRDDGDDDTPLKPWKLNLLHKDPPVFSIENFFTPRECESYKSLALDDDKHDFSQHSAVKIASPTFAASSISKRTSTTWFCRYEMVPTLLAKVQRLLGAEVGVERMEEPQIVRYRTGEEFSWHYDEIPSSQLSNGGQRQATLLVYLNDLEEDRGGATVFRDLTAPISSCDDDDDDDDPTTDRRQRRLAIRPSTGTALLFFPSYRDGTPDVRTLHKGEVALSPKMIAQVWVHERDYRAGVPEGNRQEDAVEEVERERRRLGFC
ncbi:hypothetical protein ACHAXS_005752 [Conticribra weissflogii]